MKATPVITFTTSASWIMTALTKLATMNTQLQSLSYILTITLTCMGIIAAIYKFIVWLKSVLK